MADTDEKIDVPRALELLEECVAERGADYVYGYPPEGGLDCLYVFRDVNGEPEGPGCIAGMVLNKLSIDVPREWEGTTFNGLPASEVFTPAAAGVIREAQARQDNGATWGEALEAAKQRASVPA